jgi:hypothetical protein
MLNLLFASPEQMEGRGGEVVRFLEKKSNPHLLIFHVMVSFLIYK